MLERLNRLKEQHEKNSETFNYKLEYSVLELTENILKRMEEIGVNRTELAARLNVSKSAVTRMLDGNTNFTHKRLLAIALALDCEKIDVSFPPRGFKAPDVFVSTATNRISDRDYRSDRFAHMKAQVVDIDEQVA